MKNMVTGEQVKLSPADAAAYIKKGTDLGNVPVILEK